MSKENVLTHKPRTGLILTGLMMGLLLSALDQTIVSTAMPTVIKDLGGLALYSWVFSIYMLTSTTSMPIFGKLADLYGRKRMYMIGMTIFIVGSALCGLATNMTELIVYRGIQGIGAGALMPLAMTIISDIFPPERRGKMQGLFGAVFGLSSIIGPTAGGFIVDHWHWNWIFYVNLPFGIAGLIILAVGLQDSASKKKHSIDWLGAVTLSGTIIAVLLGLVLGGNEQTPGTTHYAWSSPQIIGLFVAGAVLLALFLWIERKAKEPILPLFLFRDRVIAVTFLTGFFMSAGMFGAITYIPLFVQGVIGVTPSMAGYILTPLMLSMIIGSIFGGRLVTKIPYRILIVLSLAIMAAGFLLMSQMNVNTTNGTVILYMIIAGLGMGPLMPTLTIAAQSAVGKELRGVATSSVQFFRSIGATIGVSILGVLMTNRMTSGLSDLGSQLKDVPADKLQQFTNPQVLLDQQARAAMPQDMLHALQKVFADSVDGVFVVGMLIILLGLVIGLFMGKARFKKEEGGPVENRAAVLAE